MAVKTKEKVILVILCALTIILSLILNEVFLQIGNYYLENFSSNSEEGTPFLYPGDLNPFSHFCVNAVLMIPYAMSIALMIVSCVRLKKTKDRFYKIMLVVTIAAIVLYFAIRWLYVYHPIIFGPTFISTRPYPYESIGVIIKFFFLWIAVLIG